MEVFKTVNLKDSKGYKLTRKVYRDKTGLFVKHKGMKGYLKKEVYVIELPSYRVIRVTRKIDYYIAQ